jgi:pimeloyl-ACP methyl ester carboxylesterase
VKRGATLCVLLAVAACASSAERKTIAGRRKGSSYAFGDSAPLTIDFRDDSDSLRAFVTMNAEAMLRDKPLRNVRLDGGLLHMELVNHNGTPAVFDGRVTGDTINGNFQKNGNAVRVQLVRTGAIPSVPYRADSISFTSEDGTVLRGTAFIPHAEGPYPAVVMIHGSGPSDRTDFNYLADAFVRRGIAVLAYDKRGAGASGGDASQATVETFATDVRAAVAALARRPDIERNAIGLCGVSEGGWVAPVAASQEPHVSFVIAVVAPGDGFEVNGFYQMTMRLRSARASDSDVEKYLRAMEQVGAIVRARRSGSSDSVTDRHARATQSLLDSLNALQVFDPTDLPRLVPNGEALSHFRWRNLDFDPYPYWQKVSVPVLVVLGGRDRNLDSQVSLKRIGRALNENSNQPATFLVYDEGNHDLMVPAKGRGFHFPVPAPGYPDTLAKWTLGTLAGRR